MTVERWLGHRSPPPPVALERRIGQLLGAASQADSREAAELLVEGAERVLARLLREGCATRQSALDLLAADAMATYAFEAAADDPERMVERTDRAMARIALLAETSVAAEEPPERGEGRR